jgi:hypothetical protein
VLLRPRGGSSAGAQLCAWEERAAALGLSLRGSAGETSRLRAGAAVEVTSANRTFKTAEQQMDELYHGVGALHNMNASSTRGARRCKWARN